MRVFNEQAAQIQKVMAQLEINPQAQQMALNHTGDRCFQ
jgi:hypothetical protein